MKRLSHKVLAVAILFLLAAAVAFPDPQINRIQAFTTGVGYRVTSNLVMANSLFIQSLPGNSAVVYVLFADPALTCVASATTQIVAELGPGDATHPGESLTFPCNGSAVSSAGGFDVNWYCAAGSTGDSAILSFNVRN